MGPKQGFMFTHSISSKTESKAGSQTMNVCNVTKAYQIITNTTLAVLKVTGSMKKPGHCICYLATLSKHEHIQKAFDLGRRLGNALNLSH